MDVWYRQNASQSHLIRMPHTHVHASCAPPRIAILLPLSASKSTASEVCAYMALGTPALLMKLGMCHSPPPWCDT